MPVLVVWGADAGVLPPTDAARVRGLLPQAEVRIVPDAGHLVVVEQARAFTDALVSFLVRTR